MKICIDPGHSGPFEPGVCAGEVTEATVNMAISKLTGEEMCLYMIFPRYIYRASLKVTFGNTKGFLDLP